MNGPENIYAELWKQTIPLFERGYYETDPLIDDPADVRRGLTLRAKLPETLVSAVEEYTEKLRILLPNQYFTPGSDLHLTLLTVISCSPDFHHNPEMNEVYCALIGECVRNLSPLRITFTGITASPSSLLLCGYPENTDLQTLRDRLRKQLHTSSLPNSADFRYPLITAHVTIMRFVRERSDISRFTRFIKESRNHPFGTYTIDEVEFVSNDWCHKKSNTCLIRSFKLG